MAATGAFIPALATDPSSAHTVSGGAAPGIRDAMAGTHMTSPQRQGVHCDDTTAQHDMTSGPEPLPFVPASYHHLREPLSEIVIPTPATDPGGAPVASDGAAPGIRAVAVTGHGILMTDYIRADLSVHLTQFFLQRFGPPQS